MNNDLMQQMKRTMPNLARKLRRAEDEAKRFRSKLKLPKGCNKYVIAYAVDRVLLRGMTTEQASFGLTAKEKVFLAELVAEYRAYEGEQQKENEAP
jgi:hypothetical protein